MKTMTGEEIIANLSALVEDYSNVVEKKLKHLSEEQLNWKATSDAWSLNEVFAHLNEYAQFYHEAFQKKIQITKFRTPTDSFVSSPLGRAAWRSMKLGNAKNVKRKFRAVSAYNPSVSPKLVKGNDWKIFLDKQIELRQILKDAKRINIRKAKAPISLSKIIKFRMGDAFYFVIYHNERHVQQALNTISHPKFPKK
ncbi:MAG: DinB family protein [Crocinitomicaceae bacterium]